MGTNMKKGKGGISGNALRLWGLIFVIAGIVGRGVIQAHILGVNGAGSQELLEILNTKTNAMAYTALSIALQAAETCAVPIFAMLLVEGVQKTSDFKAYFQRVFMLALISEIPYNMAFCAKFLDFGSRNPVFGVLLCMFMLYLWSNFKESSKKNALIKFLIAFVTLLWCQMLKVDHGAAMVIIVSIFWIFRQNPMYLNFAGAAAAMTCSLISPFFLASPMGVLAVHSYNGEKSTHSHKENYLAYPVFLIIGWAFGILLQ